MLVRLVRGSTTITLSGELITVQGGGAHIAGCTYIPRSPDIGEQEVRSILRDGGDITALSRLNVTESCAVVFTCTANSALYVLDKVRQIEALLPGDMRRRTSREPVYVEFRLEDAGDVYRSEILTGRVEWPETPIGPRLKAGAAEITILWKRRFYWEGPEVELPLDNGATPNPIPGGVAIEMADDNWIDILGQYVTGVIPAPMRLEMTNTYNDANRAANIWVAHNVFSSPASFPHILEGEAATGGTTQADAGSRGGTYKHVTWTGDSEKDLLTWNLSTALLNAAQGGWFRLLTRFAALSPFSSQALVRWTVKLELSDLSVSSWVELGTDLIQDLGEVQLPPYLLRQGDLYPLKLVLSARRTGGGELSVDFVQLSATDGFRRYTAPLGYDLAYGARLVDDGIRHEVYTDSWSVAGKTGHYVAEGAPFLLEPGRRQKLYFLWTGDTGDADIARTMKVRIYHRPRRLTV